MLKRAIGEATANDERMPFIVVVQTSEHSGLAQEARLCSGLAIWQLNDASIPGNPIPARRKHLTDPCAGQQQELDCPCHVPVDFAPLLPSRKARPSLRSSSALR